MTTSQPEPDPAESGKEPEKRPFPESFDIGKIDLDEFERVFTPPTSTAIQDAAGTSPSLSQLAQALVGRFDSHKRTLECIRQKAPLDPEEVWFLLLDFHLIFQLTRNHASHLESLAENLSANGQLNRFTPLEEIGQRVAAEAEALTKLHKQLPAFWRNIPSLQELVRALAL